MCCGITVRKQSGAVSESFSDMTGEVAEFYVFGTTDWQVGAQLIKARGKAIR